MSAYTVRVATWRMVPCNSLASAFGRAEASMNNDRPVPPLMAKGAHLLEG